MATPPKRPTLLGIQSATTAPGGTVFASVVGTTKRDGIGPGVDGSAVLGLGFGDADTGLGMQAIANITSISPFADSGSLGMKVSHRLAAFEVPTYLGVSADRLVNWGDASGLDPSYTLATTTFFDIASGGDTYPVMATIGYGSDTKNQNRDPGVFIGAGIGLTKNLGVSASWSGDQVHLGAAVVLDGLENVTLTAALDDAFNQLDRQAMSFSISWSTQDLF